jgi:hypothetical protein
LYLSVSEGIKPDRLERQDVDLSHLLAQVLQDKPCQLRTVAPQLLRYVIAASQR